MSKSYDDLEIMQVDSLMAQLDDSYLKTLKKKEHFHGAVIMSVCSFQGWKELSKVISSFPRQTELNLHQSWMMLATGDL